jgi:hypothetical protein
MRGGRTMDAMQARDRSTKVRSISVIGGMVSRYALAASTIRPRRSGSVELACSINARSAVSIASSRGPSPTSCSSGIVFSN